MFLGRWDKKGSGVGVGAYLSFSLRGREGVWFGRLFEAGHLSNKAGCLLNKRLQRIKR